MDDLISREAAIEEIARRDTTDGTVKVYSGREINAILSDLPAVGAVPVVRCRDCKYGKLCFDANGQGLIQCTNPYYPASFAETWPFDLDWYCAGGERRDA